MSRVLRAVRERLWLHMMLVGVVSSILTGVAAGVVVAHEVRSSIERGQRQAAASAAVKLRKAQVAGCHRNNVKQQAADLNAYRQWQFDKLFQRAVHAPPPPDQTAQQAGFEAQARARLRDLVGSFTWTPLVANCYRTPMVQPLPVKFSARIPNIKRDLVLRRGQ